MRRNPFLAIIAIPVLFAAAGFSQQSWAPPPIEGLTTILGERIERRAAVGLVLGVVQNGKARFASAGVHAAGGAPVDERTVFEIGSVSKVFTTTLLAEMVTRGEVALDQPIRTILPASVKVPARNGREITLLDLATSSSGLPRMPTNFAPKNPSNPYADYNVTDLYAFLSGYELPREPGAAYEYSNVGMGLLGHVLALRAGQSYEALVTNRILKPLGMSDTRIELAADLRSRLAPGHGADLEPVPGWDLAVLAGAGAWRSTAADMVRFTAAAANPPAGPLGKALELAMAPRLETGRPGLSIGLGWHVLEQNGRQIAWHNGQTGGYHAFIGVDRASGANVVLLGNAATGIDDIGRHVLDPAEPVRHPPPPRPTVVVETAVLDEYVGRYELSPTFAIDVAREGDALFVQATNQPRFRAFAASPTRFFLRAVEAEIEFTRDVDDAVTGLVLIQGGREMPARKVR